MRGKKKGKEVGKRRVRACGTEKDRRRNEEAYRMPLGGGTGAPCTCTALIAGLPGRAGICEALAQREGLMNHTRVNRSPDFMSHLLPLLKALLNHNQITVNCRFLLEQESPLASLLTTLLSGDSFTAGGAGDCPGHGI